VINFQIVPGLIRMKSYPFFFETYLLPEIILKGTHVLHIFNGGAYFSSELGFDVAVLCGLWDFLV
jgi:hypothetical protein